MNIIISTELEDIYSKFVVIRSCKEVSSKTGIDTLILHKPDVDEFSIGIFIQKWYSMGIKNFIYINSEPSTTITMLLDGIGGSVIKDEFYFEEEEELLSLLEELGEEEETSSENTELATMNVDILKGFFQSFARGDERIKSPVYMEQAVQAVTDLAELTEYQSTQIVEMGHSAMDVFKRASSIISNMDAKRKQVQKQLEELQELDTHTSRPSFGGSISLFPSVKYTGIHNVLVIKEYTPCKYLTTFIMVYLHYLKVIQGKKVKLIIVHQRGAGLSTRYNEFVSITQESKDRKSLYDAEFIATNDPKTNIMRELLNKEENIFIVIDRLHGKDPIVTGRVKTLNAVSGKGDIKKFSLDKSKTIFSVTNVKDGFIYIPTIKDFPTDKGMKIQAYSQVCKDRFNILDDFIEVVKN